ncbi:DUF4254 domain-containing protein [Streptomonospora nanhaiensis]|uniref:DUF4254 domain-containing protein n=1 Tax=Streptomonospora nanhaiensis TaxID=1323731 RepID=A0A853BUT7_9ACTN|nr:DUF4254 domain-containing protein [Streptomonospora nanhaiensis]MBV2366226.1 DUF4254 domain-containing protein [Streptomonospora nanhaiensis]NYI98261.1 hypothetical protein [Streptomonospora nanhaiensis]
MTRGETNARSQVALDVRDLLPRSASIIEAFFGTTEQNSNPSLVLATAYALASLHQQQWNAEDASRRPGASVDEIAESKRRIDALNARRVSLVEQIDTWADRNVTSKTEEAPLHTETLGSVVDRLAIAWIRAKNIRESGNRNRARLALRQLMQLADAYDDLVRDIGAGQRRLPVWRSLKTYGGEAQ